MITSWGGAGHPAALRESRRFGASAANRTYHPRILSSVPARETGIVKFYDARTRGFVIAHLDGADILVSQKMSNFRSGSIPAARSRSYERRESALSRR
jgi:hypothetical protein